MKPILLIILDGFGHRDETSANAIWTAKTPFWDHLWKQYPHTLLAASGREVGLPAEQMGNSEVGHLNIGAGRIVYQDLTRIEKAIEDKTFFSHDLLCSVVQKTVAKGKAIHLLGLLSAGGVHSHESHWYAMIELAAQQGAQRIYCHAFLDGRDTPPQSAQISLQKLNLLLQRLNCGAIVSLIGRYYAMDRDNRWDRVQKAYDLIVGGQADFTAATPEEGLALAYARGETDEFVQSTAIYSQRPIKIENGDTVIFMNYRADRSRELTYALTDPHFRGFKRSILPQIGEFISLTPYASNIKAIAAFAPERPRNGLGEYLAAQGLKQLRVAETEKYAHVTYFFNGGIETPFNGEDRILIPSPPVATYDLKPEMSAYEITDCLITQLKAKKYSLITCNFANPDMVGHTGNFAATVSAIETIDQCLQQLVTAAQELDTDVIITADHGNAEMMFDPQTAQPHTAHTHNLVPFIYIGGLAKIDHTGGKLSDIAPTILYLLNLPQPVEMTGKSLLKRP